MASLVEIKSKYPRTLLFITGRVQTIVSSPVQYYYDIMDTSYYHWLMAKMREKKPTILVLDTYGAKTDASRAPRTSQH